MKKAYILLMLLSLCACAKEPTPPMLGSDGREIPMVFQNFPDIPFPDEAFLVLEDSKTVNFNAGRVFDYYVAEMPKKGWVEIAVVRAGISQMTYVKNGRAVQILIQMEGDDSAFVTVTAIPNQASVKALAN